MPETTPKTPILLIPYMWIGDFVRCHSVVKLLRARWPERPVDLLTSANNAPLLAYMPGVRQGIVFDLPRRRLPLGQYVALAARLRAENYGTALVMLRTWKAALPPFLARIPERTGFVGEWRFGLLNDLRWNERRLPRMIDRCAALALPKDAALPPEWPQPELVVSPNELAEWRDQGGLGGDPQPIIALAPGAVGTGKRWPAAHFATLARQFAADGAAVWIVGGRNETALAGEIAAAAPRVRDLTGTDLRNAILALKAANVAVSNDSGLMHVAAALGTPTIGLFGPTVPWLDAPLNPLAAIIEPDDGVTPRHGDRLTRRDVRHRRTDDIAPERVIAAVRQVLRGRRPAND
jgi:heptosyltransferase-2